MKQREKICIIGDGGWGTALALILLKNGHAVTLWSHDPVYAREMARKRENQKFLSGIKLPKKLRISSDIKSAVNESSIIVFAVPTPYLRSVLQRMKKISLTRKICVNVAKGIETTSFMTPDQILRSFIKKAPIAVLSGPSHAEEVARGIPTCVVVASSNDSISRHLQNVFMAPLFRVYRSNDVKGVELGGALKNVIAIAAGMADGLKFGANTKAALVSRGLAEIVRLGTVLGAHQETLFGLAGLGDLITTCFSPYGRNRAVGERLARGEKMKHIQSTMEMVAEGVRTARSVYMIARKKKIDMPISNEVYKVIYQNKSSKRALVDLMTRTAKAE
ncbi:MAG: NAD(P)-dependent glycerol-3-phosphate dehydrogenase [Candidatus Omnitrophica bacterium]|nr:NAD(P)-dependent glycerol-3-phosphate dehydrogenase [Candidatus Omnitrophota bacterium]